MADKMWDILKFLKNPENEGMEGDSPQMQREREQVNAQLMNALEKAENAVDEAIGKEGDRSGVAPDETMFLVEEIDASARVDAPLDNDAPFEGHRAKVSDKPVPLIEIPVRGATASANSEHTHEKPAPPVHDNRLIEQVIEEHPEAKGAKLLQISVSRIKPNPFQPRKIMGENEITELSESIKELGVLQPILVRRAENAYELIAGERRLRAAQRAGLSEIPAMVIETEPLTQQIIALVENIQRKNLSAIEEAVCLQDIIQKTGWSQMELSRRTGRSQASIANKLRLLRLDQTVQDLVISGKLGERQARSLLSLSMEEQRLLAQKAIDEDLSARALEELAESWGGKKSTSAKKRENPSETSEGPAGDLLGDLANLINKHRSKGLAAQWQVKQMNQSSLVVEISVDLLNEMKGKEA